MRGEPVVKREADEKERFSAHRATPLTSDFFHAKPRSRKEKWRKHLACRNLKVGGKSILSNYLTVVFPSSFRQGHLNQHASRVCSPAKSCNPQNLVNPVLSWILESRPFFSNAFLSRKIRRNSFANRRVSCIASRMDSKPISAADLRKEYARAGLRRADLQDDPIAQFARWFEEAVATEAIDPNAMTLATAAADGAPAARIVLLKGFDARGFVFFTNYESAKARQLAENPRAALAFYWQALERQVRIRGKVERVSREESEAYFRSRPLGSRLGAWASPQSEVVANREVLERGLNAAREKFANGEVPLPPHWGGFRVVPTSVELWQGRPNRLHDRFRYTRADEVESGWKIERLAP